MKITESTISMTAAHSLVVSESKQESLQVWGNVAGKAAISAETAREPKPAVLVDLSSGGRQLAKANATDETMLFEPSEEDKRKIALIEKFIEMLTGKKIKLVLPQAQRLHHTGAAGSNGNGQPVGWGLSYDRREVYSEQEKMAFSASGVIKTADGREIAFTANLTMSRSFYAENHISIRAGDALKDPLVINFDAPAAELTDTKFSFDIDADGLADQISFVQQGSGFLALDKNNDGMINDGRELFGTQSGDGFADLAAYDGDRNGWIDENDAIFHQLRIWTKDAAGNDYLLALGQVGIGAVYLGKAATEFAMKDMSNTQHGRLRSTGIFLRENGLPGTVQQVDLAV